ncbi:hypothetical protein F7725_008851 [Dissostichus mawsoni]|uniref:Uncharacterized protein n=1 Tax=Dissostichus mawsoni TaxID=36200 RepID=A0A7J5Z579_DISMA|nr:hypothetical protein F7725_008851 [Dissostichus mawsoni]
MEGGRGGRGGRGGGRGAEECVVVYLLASGQGFCRPPSPPPTAVGQLVADGRHDADQLQRPLVQVQRAHPGQVRAQVPVDPRALDADQGAQVQRGPVRSAQRSFPLMLLMFCRAIASVWLGRRD